MSIKDWLKLFRVKQWTKNVFVLAALVFTKGWNNPVEFTAAMLAVLAMCLASSGTYIANDILDAEKDRQHPVKQNRPIASGRIPVSTAAILSVGCLISSLLLGFIANINVTYGILVYLGVQVAYNAGLRNSAVIDVFCISIGFVIRVVVGALAINAQISSWILLCTAMLALMLGFGKRRHEFHLQGHDRRKSRRSLAEYTSQSLDMLVIFSATAAALSYGVYSIESLTAKQNPGLIMTTPFVIYGITRYIVVVFGNGETGEPESLVVSDKHLIATFIGFTLAAIAALSGFQPGFLYK